MLLSLRAFPDGSKDEPDIFAAGGGKLDLRVASGALVGVFLLFFAMGGVWSYAERIGQLSRLTDNAIASGLSIGTMAGVVGAGLAGVLPRRWGRSWPLIFSGLIGTISFLLFRDQVSSTAYILACAMMLFSWNFAQPLLSGICSEACKRGRVVCAMASIQTFGTGLGPAAAAASLITGSFAVMIYAASLILALSIIVTISTAQWGRSPA